ncbi:Ig-like domain-containing protein [Treponema sp. HNW]|uniref:Ig-like domain-containing protein n=1 Tax=Treponema sp. HNW TaxID=3116654 RepID=UPI003D09FF87
MKNTLFINITALSLLFLSACTNNLVQNTEKKDAQVPVHAIAVTSASGTISIVKDGIFKIEAFVLPVNAANKKLTFFSADTEIASVGDDGVIKAHKEGDVKITLSAANNITKKLAVKVVPQPVAVTRLRSDLPFPQSLTIGGTFKLNIEAKPSDATNKECTFFPKANSIVRIGSD